MKILVLSNMYPNRMHPNSAIFIHNQTKHLMQAGCDVLVICPVPYSPRALWFRKKWRNYGKIPFFDKIDGVRVFYPRYLNLPGTWFRKLSYWLIYMGIKKRANSIIANHAPQVLHAHTATPSGYVALMLSKKYNLPLVCSLRGSDINVYPHYDKFTMYCTKKVIERADQLVSVSRALKSEAEKIATPKKTIRTIYNGCDVESFTRNLNYRKQYREKIRISQEDSVIVFVGNLKKTKGIFELISAFHKLTHKYPNTYLYILGNGSQFTAVKSKVSSDHLNGKIHLLGSKPYNEISRWLSASDIFVLPSYYEGLPNAVLEAMACNLPVIASRVGGIPEVVEDGESGLLIKEKNVDSLSDAIEYLLKNKDSARKMGRTGRQRLQNDFSWQRNAQEMIRVYKDAIAC